MLRAINDALGLTLQEAETLLRAMVEDGRLDIGDVEVISMRSNRSSEDPDSEFIKSDLEASKI